MIKRAYFQVLCVVVGFCSAGLGWLEASGGRGLPPRAEALRTDIGYARDLMVRSLEWRQRARTFVKEAQPRLNGGVLTSGDLNALYRGGEDYVFLSRRWRALVDVQGSEAWHRAAPALVHDPLARTQTKLVLAAALVQHDDYAMGVDPYFKERKLRKLLKNDHPAVVGELDEAVQRFLDPVARLRLARAVVWYRAEGGQAEDRSEDEKFLDEVITQSPGYQFFSKQLPARVIAEWSTGGHAGVTYVMDLLSRMGSTMMNTTSLVVGNAMGLVQTRNGYLNAMPAEQRLALRNRLRPLDVLLEKTPFRLTDKSIPGHYGHVAVWVGGEEELKALGVWNDPLVRPHHQRIQAGASIVEALRPGVEINTLEHFLNIDDLLVIRRRTLTPDETKAGVLRAFAQIGKAYDFNFDVESDRKIVCSELAFVVFPDVVWPTSSVLGRYSISPDQVAVRAQGDGPFAPEVIFHDGVEVTEKLPETLDCFLKTDYARFAAQHPEFKGRSK
ncbi:MAG: YiiX/YebB-like N1pC/P60 family cysteine hydrolase [Nibricoccus sp.]